MMYRSTRQTGRLWWTAHIASAALVASVCIPASLVAVQTDFEWQGQVIGGGVVEIRGVSGDIRAVGSSGTRVEVTAVKRGRRRDFDEVTIEVVEHRRGVTICTVYRRGWRGRGDDCESGGGDWDDLRVDVDFEVRVPRGIRFSGRSVSGNVEVRNLTADAEARTVSGDIEVTTEGLARASTVSGSIRASMGRSDWRGELAFSTVSGDITVEMPDALDADVDFTAVTGELDSDFRITMRSSRFHSGRIRGTIGDGGRDLVLKTVTGNVHLRRR